MLQIDGAPAPLPRATAPAPRGTASPAAATHDATDGAHLPIDDTAETIPDTATSLAAQFAKRAEVLLLVAQSQQQEMQSRLDRMKADFNATQEERTEAMREMNALRDMALEQAKKDDEVLKKYIALI